MIRTAERRRLHARAAVAGILVLVSTAASLLLSPAQSAPAGPPTAATQATPGPPPTVPPTTPLPSGHATSTAVAARLVQAFGSGAVVDDGTACMDTDPSPLAYRTDRIILRPPSTMFTVDAVNRVAAALQAEMGPGTFTGTPETITWDRAADPAAGPAVAAGAGARASSDPPPEALIRRTVAVPVGSRNGETVPVVRVARELRAQGLMASPDYLMSPEDEIQSPLAVWPNGPPAHADKAPAPRAGLGGGTTVAVYDTGLLRTATDTLPAEGNVPPNVSVLTSADVEEPDSNRDGFADLYYTGHLTAIAGIFATLAPDAAVKAVRITDGSGVATDFSAAKRMATTLREAHGSNTWPDVVVTAFGSPTCDASTGADMVPLGLQMVAEAIDRHQEAVVVAAAGNRGSDRTFYPAAFQAGNPSVISVGALDAATDDDGDAWTSGSRSATRAAFSNYGDWVDAWAPGVRLATYHVIGLRFGPTGDTIDGFAYVDGTSYAAPYVGALIAERIAAARVTPQAAWDDVRRAGRACSGSSGPGTAVALTAMTATATTRADRGVPTAC